MNFLAPWFLIGGLAVAGPVIFHLIRRSARERVAFSSLLFLRPSLPRVTRRRKFEHILLLLLRCLALLLLAAGFSRPFFSKGNDSLSPVNKGRQTILLLDTSASMRREGLWPKAIAMARVYLGKASVEDRLSIVSFDQQPRTLVGFSEWNSWPAGQRAALAAQRLDSISPGWRGTQLGLALTTAAEQFVENLTGAQSSGPRDVVLISDLQEGAKLDGLQGRDWPKGVRVIIEKIEPRRTGNAGLTILDASSATGSGGSGARVRVVNSRDSTHEKFVMRWVNDKGSDVPGKSAEIYLPPGQTRNIPAPELPIGLATGMLKLGGDDEDFDNTAYFAVSEKERVNVNYFGAESADDPKQLRYYLQRAFPETPRRQVSIVSVITNPGSSSGPLDGASLAVIPSDLSAATAVSLRDWIAGGKTALLVLTNAQSGATFAALTGLSDPGLGEASGEYALLGDVDFAHPIFAPFADPRFSDFSRIHFWKHRVWKIPANFSAKILAKFDDGTPAFAQIPIGKGNLVVLFSSWTPDDSQLALSSKFLPLMQTILDWSGGSTTERTQFSTGDSLPSPKSSGNALRWRKPDGKIVPLAAGSPFTDTDIPGIYTIMEISRHFAINVPLEESRTAPLSVDDFARLGVPVGNALAQSTVSSPAAQHHLRQEELENRQKLWRWLLAALLVVALTEVFVGGWLGGQVRTLEVSA